MLDKFQKVIEQPYGIILVTGPTGSGKSTTLYSVLNNFDRTGINVSTVEDPVESNIEGVHQAQINPKAGFTFASALRSLLRQDPDVIMVGEIRDSETAQIAVQAALTGHVVLSTLHTNDAPSAKKHFNYAGVVIHRHGTIRDGAHAGECSIRQRKGVADANGLITKHRQLAANYGFQRETRQ